MTSLFLYRLEMGEPRSTLGDGSGVPAIGGQTVRLSVRGRDIRRGRSSGNFLKIEPKAVLRVVEGEWRSVNNERRYFTPEKLADGQRSHTRGRHKHKERKER